MVKLRSRNPIIWATVLCCPKSRIRQVVFTVTFMFQSTAKLFDIIVDEAKNKKRKKRKGIRKKPTPWFLKQLEKERQYRERQKEREARKAVPAVCEFFQKATCARVGQGLENRPTYGEYLRNVRSRHWGLKHSLTFRFCRLAFAFRVLNCWKIVFT